MAGRDDGGQETGNRVKQPVLPPALARRIEKWHFAKTPTRAISLPCFARKIIITPSFSWWRHLLGSRQEPRSSCPLSDRHRRYDLQHLCHLDGLLTASQADLKQMNVKILSGVMSAAYLTAELWLGAFASILALIVPVRTETFTLAIYTATITLIYSSAPQIIALRDYDPESDAYVQQERYILTASFHWILGRWHRVSISSAKSPR